MNIRSQIKCLFIAIILGCGISSIAYAQGGYDDVQVQGGEVGCEEPVARPLAPSPADCEDSAAHAPVKQVAPVQAVQKKSSGGLFKSTTNLPKNLPRTGGSIDNDIDPKEYQDFWRDQEDDMIKKNEIKNQNIDSTATDSNSDSDVQFNFWDNVEVSQNKASDVPMILAAIEANKELGEHASAGLPQSLPTTLARAFKYHPEDVIVIALLLAALFAITFI